MKSVRVNSLRVLCGLAVAAVTLAYAREIVVQRDVDIPFSEPGGNIMKPATSVFKLPAGSYIITLRVVRAEWDRNVDSLARKIPIGIGAYCMMPDKREVNKEPWKTGNGEVSIPIHVPPNCSVHVVFSTIAPPGAKGVLVIEKEERRPVSR